MSDLSIQGRHWRQRAWATAAFAAAAVVSGCAVGPRFVPPAAPSSTSYVRGGLPAQTLSSAYPGGHAQRFVPGLDIPGDWWTLFRSNELNALVERALRNNPTLEAAQAALRGAEESVAAGRGAYFPAVSGAVGADRQRASGAAFGSPRGFLYTLNSASVNVSYTLDAFGGVRRQVEALRAQAEYQQFSLEASYLSLTANIVTAAVTEASLKEQIAATRRIAAAQRAQLQIVKRRVAAGGASRADLMQQQAALASTLAVLPQLRHSLGVERNVLAAYVGTMPERFGDADFRLDSLTLPKDLPVSVPSKLVEQRPDVRAYAALLHAATAEVGVATADMLPQITLSGSYGGQAVRFADLFSPASTVWSIAASLTQPIFKGGELLHQRRAAIAAAQGAAANYRATVLTAFQDVSNTLQALEADAQSFAAYASAAEAAQTGRDLVQAQYNSGAASYVQLLTADENYQSAAIALVKARAQRYADTAALFQALGGGWWHRADAKTIYPACCKGHL